MRTSKRLFDVLLVTILLAGLTTAQAIGISANRLSPGVTRSQITPGYDHAPSQLRLDFGTVVRDTADEHSVGPGQWQVPRQAFLLNSFLNWNWVGMLLFGR